MRVEQLDVLIIGGGVAGCASAFSLLKYGQNLRCVIVDDSDPSQFKLGESLPPEALLFLGQLESNLPKRLKDETTSGIHLYCAGNASVWATEELEERHSIMNPFGNGFHLNRAAFDNFLRDLLVDSVGQAGSQIELIHGKFINVMKTTSGGWEVKIDIGSSVKILYAKWLVDATGRKASLVTKLGAKTVLTDQLLAFYMLFQGPNALSGEEVDNDSRTIVEATPNGWFYTSLVCKCPPTRIVVYHTTPSHASAKQARKKDGFLDLLAETAIHIPRLVQAHDYSPLVGYPKCTAAGTSYLDRVANAKERWIAVGDAAAAFDPLSSQGMITGLEMGLYLGAMISEHLCGEVKSDAAEKAWEEMYSALRVNYRKNRGYYYSIVKRYPGEEFWEKVI